MRARGIASPAFDFTADDWGDLSRIPDKHESPRESGNHVKPIVRQLESLVNKLQIKRLLMMLDPRPLRRIRDHHDRSRRQFIELFDDDKILRLLQRLRYRQVSAL